MEHIRRIQLLMLILQLACFRASGDGHLWAFAHAQSGDNHLLYKVDPTDGSIADTITSDFIYNAQGTELPDALGMTYGDGHLWAFAHARSGDNHLLYKVDPTDGSIADTITSDFIYNAQGTELPDALGMTYGDGHLWAFAHARSGDNHLLYKIDPTDGSIADTITSDFIYNAQGTELPDALGMTYGDGHLWAFAHAQSGDNHLLYKIDPTDGSIADTITSDFIYNAQGTELPDALGMTYGDGHLWAFAHAQSGDNHLLYKIDPTDGSIADTITSDFIYNAQGTELPDALGMTYGGIFIPPNSPPTDINLSNNSISENHPIGTVVGALNTIDPDIGNSFTYTLPSGVVLPLQTSTSSIDNDNNLFKIIGNELQSKYALNYEARSTYDVKIRTTDQGGLWYEKLFLIYVQDMEEYPLEIFDAIYLPSGYQIKWNTEAGYLYRVQYTDSLIPAIWENVVPDIYARNGETNAIYTDTSASTNSGRRFYKVLKIPDPIIIPF